MSLSDLKARQAFPREKIYFLADDDGLSLKVEPNGRKSWSYRYTFLPSGKRSRVKLGSYPEVSLKQARYIRDNYKLNHYQFKKDDVINLQKFQNISHEWLEFKIKKSGLDKPRAGVIQQAKRCLEKEIYPDVGDMDFLNVKRYDLIKILKKIESRGVKEPVKKAYSYLNQIYDYAVAMGYCEYNIIQGVNKVFIDSRVKRHYPYLTGHEIPQFIDKLNKINAHPILKKALLFKLYTGVRGTELSKSEIHHFDLSNKIWRIPALHIKQLRRKVLQGHDIPDFIVPLSDQAIKILESALEWSYGEKYVFCSPKIKDQPIHFNTLNYLIRKMGYSKNQLSSHGLRSTFSTVLNESGLFQDNWIETQLSHSDRNKVRASYNHADYLSQRKEMMQWWANYIDRAS